MKWLIISFVVIILVFITVLLFFGKGALDSKDFLLPGIQHVSSDLVEKLQKRAESVGVSYKPRTRHLDSEGRPLFTNRLFLEKSPYLLQHAHNPVNWYPWGDEAFQSAKEKNLPILLSVGYSTCHWCHVMEEESFEDIEIAQYMNENYVAIKVDREERPDIDSVYMQAVQMLTGRGGWPMTVWLTPSKAPFFGGTYFPARTGDRGSSTGFLHLLKELKKTYDEKQELIVQDSDKIKQLIQQSLSSEKTANIPSKEIFKTVYQEVKNRLDPVYGGMRRAPKFPSSFPSGFLLRSYLKTKDEGILQSIRTSLMGMFKGGMHDHVGGGFHRYSVDEKWLVPHFEKMLYDQALLALSYLEAYQLLRDESFKETAKGILDYVMRDMQSPSGGLYSATDADSLSDRGEKEEGYYFTWTSKELDQVLDSDTALLIKTYYGVTEFGNFEGRNIFYVSKPLSETAHQLNIPLPKAKDMLARAKEQLYQTRNLRSLPLRDEKVLSAWNGLMIKAFIYGFFVLGEKKYLLQAEKIGKFILDHVYKEGRLYRSWKEGQAYIGAYLDDYASVISALLDLFEWTGHMEWFHKAMELDQVLAESFEDKEHGGFFMTSHDSESLIAREKPAYDGAEPSGNAIAVLNLLRLSEITGNDLYRQRAEKAFQSFSPSIERNPLAFSEWLIALDFYYSRVNEIVLVLPEGEDIFQNPLFSELKKWYLPNKVLMVVYQSDVEKYQELLKPISRKKAINGKPTIYICDKGACQLPATDLKTLRSQLKEIQSLNYF